jgi:Arc/MetJ-type ribon-helix-helix transcriptional regulator
MPALIQAEIPDGLWQQASTLVSQGWAGNVQEVVNESLRRYLESHQDALAERFVRDDVAWALHGKD